MKKIKLYYSRIFEALVVWTLSISLISIILLIANIIQALPNIRLLIQLNPNLSLLMENIYKFSDKFKSVETLSQITRIFTIIQVIAFIIFVIYMIYKKEAKKLMRLNHTFTMMATLTSILLLYITKDVFYSIEKINNVLLDKSEKVELLTSKLQYLVEIRYFILLVVLFLIIFISIALLMNTYMLMTVKHDNWIVLSGTIFSLYIIFIIYIMSSMIYINKAYNIIDLSKYMLINYSTSLRGENIYIEPMLDIKSINRKYISRDKRELLINNINYIAINADKLVKKGEVYGIIAKYDDKKFKEQNIEVINSIAEIETNNVIVVKDNQIVNMNSLLDYMNKYDDRYMKIGEKYYDDITGVYYIKGLVLPKYFIVQKVPTSLDDTREYYYNLINIGHIYIDSLGKVVGYDMINKEKKLYDSEESILKELKKLKANKID